MTTQKEKHTLRLARYNVRFTFFLLLSLIWLGTGCGLEVLFIGLPTRGEHKAPEIKPTTRLQGQAVGLPDATVSIRAGVNQIAQGKTDSKGSFDIELPKSTDFFNLIIEVTKDALFIKSIVPEIPQSQKTDVGKLDTTTTTITLIIEAALSSKGLLPLNYPSKGTALLLKQLKAELNTKEPFSKFKKMVEAIHKIAEKQSSSKAFFQAPIYHPANSSKELPKVQRSGLNKNAMGSGIDYCPEKTFSGCVQGVETTTEGFDQALATCIQALKFPTCTAGKKLQLIFTVTLDPNAKDGNCATIKQFKHAKLHGGLSCDKCKVYFAGGIHKDSSITDPKLSQMLGNWEPNKTQMYDDGTHGDLIAGDGIWTLAFSVPAPISTKKSCKIASDCGKNEACIQKICHKTLRLGYKYTYGLTGNIWGGTEEFPGNQRLLEVIDQNGDGFVSRHDNFADETANKDRVNTLQKKGATGMLCFAEPAKTLCGKDNPKDNHPDCGCKIDQDGDGIPDVRERPWDQNNDCKPEGFQVFANVQPLVTGCK